MTVSMDLTILIPTFRGQESLPRLFGSLVRMRRVPGFRGQIVVIDNNSPDDTRGLVEEWRTRIPELEYLFHGQPGKCHALNAGLAVSSARWVAFLDHDVEVEEGYLQGIHRAITTNPDFRVFGGRILADMGEALPIGSIAGSRSKIRAAESSRTIMERRIASTTPECDCRSVLISSVSVICSIV